jgi:hypothetical protein
MADRSGALLVAWSISIKEKRRIRGEGSREKDLAKALSSTAFSLQGGKRKGARVTKRVACAF